MCKTLTEPDEAVHMGTFAACTGVITTHPVLDARVSDYELPTAITEHIRYPLCIARATALPTLLACVHAQVPFLGLIYM